MDGDGFEYDCDCHTISLAFCRLPASFSGLANGMANETVYDCFEVVVSAAGRLSMFRL